jgi:hypothetical protein
MLVAAVGNAAAFCQTQQPVTRPEFEVASIRPHANGDNRAYVQASEGRLAMANFSLNVALYLTCRPRFVCFQQLACCTKPVDTAFNL